MPHLTPSTRKFIEELRSQGKTTLAKVLENNWNKSIHEYSKELFSYSPKRGLEPALRHAFATELRARGHKPEKTSDILEWIETRRVLQTAPHTGITQTPRMLCIDYLSTRGLKDNDYYIVATFSGVPFSNDSRPGRIKFAKKEYNFITKTHQDALVYKSTIKEKAIQTYDDLDPLLQHEITKPTLGALFPQWAMDNAEATTKKVIHFENIIHIDIGNVISHYLQQVLTDTEHPLSKILFDPTTKSKILKSFGPHIHFFYTPYTSKKYEKQESLYFEGMSLTARKLRKSYDPSVVLDGLLFERICPATLLTFTALSFINHFKCIGSFRQVEYLTTFKKNLLETGIFDEYQFSNVPTGSLATGSFPKNKDTSVLDYILGNTEFPDKNYTLGELIAPIKKLLLT